ncbi:MAG TPA: hypothetical protein VFP93_01255 [Gammaproteobacteria bacterium]|nr:hypothetical protein [Gammaproteobacteria bacterium]
MADENENEFEEEFDFESEEELIEPAEGEVTTFEEPRKKPPLPLLVGGALAAIAALGIGAYMFMGTKEELPPPAPAPQVVEPPPPAPMVPAAPDPWDQGMLTEEDSKPKVTPQNIVEKLEAQEREINQQIQALERKLNELLSKLSSLDQAIGSSNRDLAQVSRKLEALNQELKMLATPAKEQEKPEAELQQSASYVNPSLTVHAIIPGRAWLKTRDGRTLTVTEGDPVEGYGKVIVIDAPSGIVITSSGVVLR